MTDYDGIYLVLAQRTGDLGLMWPQLSSAHRRFRAHLSLIKLRASLAQKPARVVQPEVGFGLPEPDPAPPNVRPRCRRLVHRNTDRKVSFCTVK
eukprot:69807-Rhodomonas_salina.2